MNSLKKVIGIIIILAVSVLIFAGCSKAGTGSADVVSITDSSGRVVEIPKKVNKVASGGVVAQVYLYTMNPDKMVGWAKEPSKIESKYIDKKHLDKPVFGQIYGKNAKLNVEEIIKAKPDVIIDMGEKKKGIKEDLDKIQKQLGIPVVFIEATMDTLPKAYRTLGEVMGDRERAEKLATYTENTINEAKEKASLIAEKDKKRIYYGDGQTGLEINPVGSVQADVIEIIGAVNVADVSGDKSSGGKEVTIEQVILWKPDVLMFGPKSVYPGIKENKVWKDLEAVKNGKVYEVPIGPYNFMGRPPSVNRVIGIKWLGNLIYPEVYKYNMLYEVQEFYRLFYNYNLSVDDARELLKNSSLLLK